MKNLAGILIILLSVLTAHAQDMKYKDIYPYIESRDYREAVPYLVEFLQYEPDHPSANLQLALIYEQRFTSYHPILKFKAAMKNAENAKTRFLKARLLVDEREIKKNGKKFYTNFARIDDRGKLDVEYSSVRLKIDSAYMKIDNFIRYVPAIYKYFTKSVQYYDKASKRFAELNGEYGSLKELYLLYDTDLKNSLAQLKSDYDSALYTLEEYLKAAEDYPVTEFEQSYVIKPIVHYRLDGLTTQNNFLVEEIELWDYGIWVDQVNDMVATEIATLRRQIELNEQKLNETIEILKNPSQAITANVTPKDVDRELILKLRNYDYNSIITPLLLYKTSKQDLLYQSLMEFEIAEDTINTGSIETLLAYYARMFSLSHKSDSLIQDLSDRNTELNLMKYENFVDDYYRGDDGLSTFISSEQKFTRQKMDEYSTLIKESLFNNLKLYPDSSKFVSFDKQDIPVYINMPDSLNAAGNNFYTSHIQIVPDSSYYIAGMTGGKSEKDHGKAFLVRIDKDDKVLWLNTFEINKEKLDSLISGSGIENVASGDSVSQERIIDNMIGAIEITPEGCALLMTSRDRNSGRLFNTFKVISENGEEIRSGIILTDAIARNLTYNDKSNSYVASFKGKHVKNNIRNSEPLHLKRIDGPGNIEWETDLFLSGDVREIINIDNGYLVSGNYTQIRKLTGNEVITNPDPDFTNTYIYKLDTEGETTEQLLIRSEVPFYTDRIIKINDGSINLLGFPGKEKRPISDYRDNLDEIIHIITNSQLRVLKTNFEIL